MEATSVPSEGTNRVVEYVHAESLDGVPNTVDTQVRRRVVDTLAAVTAGFQFREMDTIREFAGATFGDGPMTVLDGSGATSNGPGATLSNTVAANVLDVDDGNRLAEGHPAAVVLPAAIAAVESADGTVGDLLEAFLPAYEVAVRTSLAMHEWIGMHTGSGSWGAVAAAAAVARAEGFDPEQTGHALGIAEFNAPITPVMRSVANPSSSMTKDGIGWGGYVGYTAAQLAGMGVTGSGTVFDEIEHERLDPALLESLGERYHIRESYYKPYPACRWIHPGIDAVAELLSENAVDPSAVESVDVYTHPKGAELGIRRPDTPSEAEYSYPFVIAAAIRNRGEFGPTDLTAEARGDETTLALADRIALHVDPEAADRYPEESLARVRIETDGASFESDLLNPRGSKERPLSTEAQEAKWRLMLDEYLGEGTTETLLERVHEDDAPIESLLEPWQD